jgi:hypothetical protein
LIIEKLSNFFMDQNYLSSCNSTNCHIVFGGNPSLLPGDVSICEFHLQQVIQLPSRVETIVLKGTYLKSKTTKLCGQCYFYGSGARGSSSNVWIYCNATVTPGINILPNDAFAIALTTLDDAPTFCILIAYFQEPCIYHTERCCIALT